MRKNIGILTFSFADNYGALLQCYALQKACEQNGCNSKIIKYEPMTSLRTYIRNYILPTRQHKLFNDFRKQYFSYYCKTDKLDTIIVGSDQVWNPQIIAYDDYWICPKIQCNNICSYAASFGKTNLTGKDLQFLQENQDAFEKYSFISVREQTGKTILSNIDIKAQIVCDPTLLFYFDPSIYLELVENSRLNNKRVYNNSQKSFELPEDYILVYSLEHLEEIDKIASSMSDKLNAKIVSIHPMNDQTQNSDLFLFDTTVYDFLYLIKNAKMVITNSFHGLSLSFIFRKKVICVLHSLLSSRQTELINRSGFKYETMNENVYFIDSDQDSELFSSYVNESRKAFDMITSL